MTSHIAQKRQNLGINTGNIDVVHGEFMFLTNTARWKGIANGRTSLPELSLPNMMTYIVM